MSSKQEWSSPTIKVLSVSETAAGVPAQVEQTVMIGEFTTQQQGPVPLDPS